MFIRETWADTEKRFREQGSAEAPAAPETKGEHLVVPDSPDRIRTRLRRLGFDSLAESVSVQGVPIALLQRELVSADGTRRLGLERVLGQNEMTPISFLTEGARASRTVGRIRVRNAQRKTQGWGTGFLVSPRLVLTNHHVLEASEVAYYSLLEMNYEEGPLGRMLPTVSFELEPNRLFITNVGLDFSLVAVKAVSLSGQPLRQFGFNKLIDETGKALQGERVNIIQHPGGQPKQVALRENTISNVFDNFVHYVTDTSPGSSGSPVYSDQWEVVALHHAGVPRKDEQGRILAVGGGLWRSGLEPIWDANEGIRVSRLIAYLKAQPLTGVAADLLAQLLEATPSSGEAGHATATTPTATVPMTEGATEVTIPVRIRVTVPDVVTPPTPPSPAPAPSEPPAGPAPSPTPPAGPEYYDAEADGRARDAYYGDLDFGAAPDALYEALSALVASTHSSRIPYKEARLEHLYPTVDLHPDGLLRSVYSGNSFSPDEIIRAELALEAQVEARLQELLVSESLSSDQLERELELFERSLPFNCEHVVPQSWFGKREPMKGDLHHLFTCESGCNSFRSNIPYFDFADFGEAIRTACGKREAQGFEPSASKGAVARATLYFLLRYPGKVSRSNATLDTDRIRLLTAWSNSDAPGPHERHRNAAIFEAQGNRNPFIDKPDLVDKTNFLLGLG